jgi:hypothetical protein
MAVDSAFLVTSAKHRRLPLRSQLNRDFLSHLFPSSFFSSKLRILYIKLFYSFCQDNKKPPAFNGQSYYCLSEVEGQLTANFYPFNRLRE